MYFIFSVESKTGNQRAMVELLRREVPYFIMHRWQHATCGLNNADLNSVD